MLVYDGDCGFCTRSARWIERRLPADVPVVAWQSLPDLSAHGLTPEGVASAAWWIEPDGSPLAGHLAVGASLRAAGGAWGLVGRAILRPPLRWLARPAYRIIASNRYRLPGATDACRIDEPR